MPNKAFDTLAVARGLKAAGVEAEQADAFVEAMARSTGKFVTVEHFDAAVAKLDSRIDAVRTELLARIDGLQARIDAVRTELQAGIRAVRTETKADIARSLAITVSVIIAAITLMTAILGFLMMDGAAM